jgi:putative ABC transport system permease protein
MRLIPTLRTAFDALARHRLRSALSVLGISLGVAAFLCSVAIGQGATRQLEDQIHSLGDNLIWVEAGSRTVNGVRTGTYGTKSLTVGDARAIAAEIPLVVNVSPHVNTRVPVVAGNQNWTTMVRGVSPEYLAARQWPVARGTAFTQGDVAYAAKVCLLGRTVADAVFGSTDPVGQTLRVKAIPCTVIGILARKGQSPIGQDQDDVILMPYTTVQKKIKGITWLDDLMGTAVSAADLPAAEADIRALLRERHHLVTEDQPDDFNLRHPADLAQTQASAQQTMTLLLASVALVALLVAGVGIMNIMLVSVTERIREIGLRLAVGARPRDILRQFLFEAVTLSLLGGSAGIGLGLIGVGGFAALAGWRTAVGPGAVLVALGFASLTGIGFGYYPARWAAQLDPIVALNR